VTKRPEFTFSGERPDQVVSALRKDIRRGEVVNALHWLVELVLSGEEWWAWRQLVIGTSEESGDRNQRGMRTRMARGPHHDRGPLRMWRMNSDPLHAVDATIRLCRRPSPGSLATPSLPT
jgi:hypothetical protein